MPRTWTAEEILERIERERGHRSLAILERFRRRLTKLTDKRTDIRWEGSGLRTDEHATLWPWVVHKEVFYYPPACFRVDGKVEIPLRYMKRLPGRWNVDEVLHEAPERTPFNDEELRRKLLDHINEIPGVSLPDTVDSRPTFRLQLLNDEEAVDKLAKVFEWYIGEIVNSDERRGTETQPLLNLYEDYSREEVHDIFSPNTLFTPQSGTWGLHGIVAIPDRPGDFVLFVTLGQQQGDHVFDEGITEDGVLSWQSQPRQGLDSPQILEFVEHDELKNSIYLFFRTARRAKYTYLGRLKYLSHDVERENPVYFQWQILDWDPPVEVLDRMGLALQPSTNEEARRRPRIENRLQQTSPPASAYRKSTSTFRARKTPDYSAIDSRNRDLGMAGERLVVEHEKQSLIEGGRPDLAEKVRHVSLVEGDGAGYDVMSYTPEGETKYIEAKTTRGSADTPFYMSANEVEFSRQHPDNYYLYRVYDYESSQNFGQLYVESGSVEDRFDLTPTQYRVIRR